MYELWFAPNFRGDSFIREHKIEKFAARSGQSLFPPVNHSGRPYEFRRIKGYGNQPVLLDLGLDCALREDADARTEYDRRFNGLNIVELHHDRNADFVLPQEAVEFPANDHLVVKSDEVLTLKILRQKKFAAGKLVARINRNSHPFF